ncbi:MAG: hypothetical protein WC755_05375 [Candidatus Woesearchaeota archaeon]
MDKRIFYASLINVIFIVVLFISYIFLSATYISADLYGNTDLSVLQKSEGLNSSDYMFVNKYFSNFKLMLLSIFLTFFFMIISYCIVTYFSNKILFQKTGFVRYFVISFIVMIVFLAIIFGFYKLLNFSQFGYLFIVAFILFYFYFVAIQVNCFSSKNLIDIFKISKRQFFVILCFLSIFLLFFLVSYVILSFVPYVDILVILLYVYLSTYFKAVLYNG